MKAYDVEDDETFKKFSHKKDITKDLYYNVFCGDVADMNLKLPKKDYSLLIANIPYKFRMAGSSYDDEPFKFKYLEKMVKDFAELTTTILWRIVVFHSMAQGSLWLRHCDLIVMELRTLLGKDFTLLHLE